MLIMEVDFGEFGTTVFDERFFYGALVLIDGLVEMSAVSPFVISVSSVTPDPALSTKLAATVKRSERHERSSSQIPIFITTSPTPKTINGFKIITPLETSILGRAFRTTRNT